MVYSLGSRPCAPVLGVLPRSQATTGGAAMVPRKSGPVGYKWRLETSRHRALCIPLGFALSIALVPSMPIHRYPASTGVSVTFSSLSTPSVHSTHEGKGKELAL